MNKLPWGEHFLYSFRQTAYSFCYVILREICGIGVYIVAVKSGKISGVVKGTKKDSSTQAHNTDCATPLKIKESIKGIAELIETVKEN